MKEICYKTNITLTFLTIVIEFIKINENKITICDLKRTYISCYVCPCYHF